MAKLIITYWRDIPAQVTAKAGRKTAKIQLTDRFQEAIDMAAMRAGKDGTDAYLEDWRREQSECSDDIEAVVKEQAEQLEASFTTDVLQSVVKNHGIVGKPDN
jgi:hypothetical protein